MSASQTSGWTFGRDLTTANENGRRSFNCVGQKQSARLRSSVDVCVIFFRRTYFGGFRPDSFFTPQLSCHFHLGIHAVLGRFYYVTCMNMAVP
jgi:hypothetical protein